MGKKPGTFKRPPTFPDVFNEIMDNFPFERAMVLDNEEMSAKHQRDVRALREMAAEALQILWNSDNTRSIGAGLFTAFRTKRHYGLRFTCKGGRPYCKLEIEVRTVR